MLFPPRVSGTWEHFIDQAAQRRQRQHAWGGILGARSPQFLVKYPLLELEPCASQRQFTFIFRECPGPQLQRTSVHFPLTQGCPYTSLPFLPRSTPNTPYPEKPFRSDVWEFAMGSQTAGVGRSPEATQPSFLIFRQAENKSALLQDLWPV